MTESGSRPADRLPSPRRKLAFVAVANMAAFVAAAILVEFTGCLSLAWKPAYDVLFLVPDRELGSRQVPGHE